jgi:putative transposase
MIWQSRPRDCPGGGEKSWRRLDGHNQLPKLIQGVKFIDGVEAVRQQPQAAA